MTDHNAQGSVAEARPHPAAKDAVGDELAQVGAGTHHHPHSLLGAQIGSHEVSYRVRRPHALAVDVVRSDGSRVGLAAVGHGLWTGSGPVVADADYRIETTDQSGHTVTADDPYRHPVAVPAFDLHLLGEGRHLHLWQVLGAHCERVLGPLGDVEGVRFSVWAPNACAVQVRGDFNDWDGAGHALSSLGTSGVWQIFVPDAHPHQCYKFALCHRSGHWVEKADPFARWAQVPPDTASRVVTSSFEWSDQQWVTDRAESSVWSHPMSIYEVHLGSWRPGLNYRQLAEQLAEYVVAQGFSHVEFMPVAEHPFGGSWGYQVTSYYAPTSRFGSPDEFKFLIDVLHAHGVGVLLDWVPAHFPKDDWALARFDGEPLFEHADPRRGEHPDWGTLIFDYGRHEVRNFLVANAVYWLTEFHLDGLRVDAVASMLYLDYSRGPEQWTPNAVGGRENLDAVAFVQELTDACTTMAPGSVIIAEESTAWPGVTAARADGGLGFGAKWNMGWMHDTLSYISRDPAHRSFHHHEVTFGLEYCWSERYVLPISHDEVVHGKGTLVTRVGGSWGERLATVRAFFAHMWAHPGRQLLFMGQEFAQVSEWSHDAGVEWSLLEQPEHVGVQRVVRDLNALQRRFPALWELDFSPEGFEWLVAQAADQNTFAFLRKDSTGRCVACVVNFSGSTHDRFELPLPHGGGWREILNTNAQVYGGQGVGNAGFVVAYEHFRGTRWPASAQIVLPAFTAMWFVPA